MCVCMHASLLEMLRSHLRKNAIEVLLVHSVNKPVVEDSLALMTEETKDVIVFPDHTRVCLQHTFSVHG